MGMSRNDSVVDGDFGRKMQSLPYAYALFEGLAVGIFVKNFGLKN